jgi:hypothetical protein
MRNIQNGEIRPNGVTAPFYLIHLSQKPRLPRYLGLCDPLARYEARRETEGYVGGDQRMLVYPPRWQTDFPIRPFSEAACDSHTSESPIDARFASDR